MMENIILVIFECYNIDHGKLNKPPLCNQIGDTISLQNTLTLDVSSLCHLKLTKKKEKKGRGSHGIWTPDLSYPKPVITHSTPHL